jgi:hypothetical protein
MALEYTAAGTLRWGLLALLVGLGCFALGLFVGHGSREEFRAELKAVLSAQVRSDLNAESPVAAHCAVSIDPSLLRAELTRALGSSGLGNSAPVPVASAATQEAPPPSPEEVAAFDQAHSVVEVAIARGHMTKEQSQEMRELMASVDPQARQELRLQMVRALNQGKLTLEDRKPPF